MSFRCWGTGSYPIDRAILQKFRFEKPGLQMGGCIKIPNSWMVFNGKSENKMDDWGYPSLLETSLNSPPAVISFTMVFNWFLLAPRPMMAGVGRKPSNKPSTSHTFWICLKSFFLCNWVTTTAIGVNNSSNDLTPKSVWIKTYQRWCSQTLNETWRSELLKHP